MAAHRRSLGYELKEPDWRKLFPEEARNDPNYHPSVDAQGRKVSQRELIQKMRAEGKLSKDPVGDWHRKQKEQAS